MTVYSTSGLNQVRYLSLVLVGWSGTCMWGIPFLHSWVLGYSKNNPKGWVDDIYTFLKKALGIYRIVIWPLEYKLSPLEIPQICATRLRNSKNKNPKQMENPHEFFLITPRKPISFLINSGKTACFFQYPLKFHILNSSCLVFFWNGVVIKNMFG